MNWLGWLLSFLVKPGLDWLLGKLKAWEAARRRDEAIEKRAQEQADALKKSKTDDEDEKAAKDILSGR